jgi:hypothetical protein
MLFVKRINLTTGADHKRLIECAIVSETFMAAVIIATASARLAENIGTRPCPTHPMASSIWWKI